ncbi:hypothetical protein SKA34_13415 [Photobacterium sp. SKA34]|nr:hypothetical protein SKA34_13415 [Photobacterium sp. SKA34]
MCYVSLAGLSRHFSDDVFSEKLKLEGGGSQSYVPTYLSRSSKVINKTVTWLDTNWSR